MPQRLAINKNGVNGWYCTVHNVYNDILREQCCYCNEVRDASLAVIANKVKWRRTGWLTDMSEVERELHAEFFTRWSDDERLLIKDMNDDELTAHRNELARIALESKVRTTTADEEIRQRRANKKGSETRQWLVPTDVEDTVKQVRERQGRMTKLDKINEALLNLMSEEDAALLMNGNIKKVGDAKLGVIKIVKSDVKQPENPKDSEPFDFTKLDE